MKETLQEKIIYRNFQPGVITREGFLGNDTRHIHDIIEADRRVLSGLGIGQREIADRLNYFIQEGKRGLESTVKLGEFAVQVVWIRGMLPSPFGDKQMIPKLIATVTRPSEQQQIRYTQLNVHMIREFGFFEGKGSVYRLDPKYSVEFLKLLTSSKGGIQ